MAELTATTGRRARPRRVRRGVLAVAVLVVLVLAVALAWWLFIRDERPTAGPLANPEAVGFSFRQHPGDTIGYGVPVAFNTGARPAVLKRIRLVNPTPGLEVLATRVAGPDRKLLSVALTDTWPSREFDDVHPVAGYTVAPRTTAQGERGVELIFGLRVTKLGDYQSQAAAIEYTVDGTQHVAYVRAALRICVVPPSEPLDGECATPDGVNDPINDDL